MKKYLNTTKRIAVNNNIIQTIEKYYCDYLKSKKKVLHCGKTTDVKPSRGKYTKPFVGHGDCPQRRTKIVIIYHRA